MSPSPEADRLAGSLDRLDHVFMDVELPSELGGCTYCWPEGWDSLLLPINDVPYDDLVSFAMEGSDHWDQYPPMLRRMFPRIARQLSNGTLHVSAPWVLSHLAEAKWQEWRPDERAAIAEFLDAFFKVTLSREPTSELDGGEVLEGVSAATGDVGPWLVVWDGLPVERTARHLPFVRRQRPHRGAPGWWPRGSEEQLEEWLPGAERRLPLP